MLLTKHYRYIYFIIALLILPFGYFSDPFKLLFKNYPSFLKKIQSLFKKSKPTYIYLNKGSKNGLWTCYCRPNGHGEWFKRRNNGHVNYAENVYVNVTSDWTRKILHSCKQYKKAVSFISIGMLLC